MNNTTVTLQEFTYPELLPLHPQEDVTFIQSLVITSQSGGQILCPLCPQTTVRKARANYYIGRWQMCQLTRCNAKNCMKPKECTYNFQKPVNILCLLHITGGIFHAFRWSQTLGKPTPACVEVIF